MPLSREAKEAGELRVYYDVTRCVWLLNSVLNTSLASLTVNSSVQLLPPSNVSPKHLCKEKILAKLSSASLPPRRLRSSAASPAQQIKPGSSSREVFFSGEGWEARAGGPFCSLRCPSERKA